MGGHGGLNILPQKRWNVYNFDNREKVRKDEEAASREDQLKLDHSRRQALESRLQTLRRSRGNFPPPPPSPPPSSNHINLFDEKSAGFADLGGDEIKKPAVKVDKELGREMKRMRREKEKAEPVTAEDEKYRLGYGVAGKGVKAPWYLGRSRSGADFEEEKREEVKKKKKSGGGGGGGGGKKSIAELREERMRRERKEKERERELLRQGQGFLRRR